ncbi:MAG TPA: response regulator, partial [Planctomycetota bacterium]|nr:response regulator [Planctomycetota bacterium]
LLLAISDSGTGMTEDVKAHLFEPFFTTKEVGKGTGLGLATVHGIVKQSNGHINVYSEFGRGTTFKIYLPVVRQEASAVRRVPVTMDSLRGEESILLVEDDPHVRTLSAAILTRAGYQVQQARRGEEALGLVEMPGNKLNLLLTDLIMPGMNGVELARALRSTRPDLKVLFTSGYTDSTLLKDGFLTPDTPFITKPFTPELLLRKVREVLGSKPGEPPP